MVGGRAGDRIDRGIQFSLVRITLCIKEIGRGCRIDD